MLHVMETEKISCTVANGSSADARATVLWQMEGFIHLSVYHSRSTQGQDKKQR